MLSARPTTAGIFAGVLAGVGFNLVLWVGFPETFWMWWNFFGLAVTVVVAYVVSLVTPSRPLEEIRPYTLFGSGFFEGQRLWHVGYTVLLVYFVVLLGFLLFLNYFAGTLGSGAT